MKLFLCSTPLQLKIAIRIIDEKKLHNVVVLFTGDLPNRRSTFYLNQMKNSVENILLFDKNKYLTKSNSHYLQKKAREIIQKFQLTDVDTVYLANLNDRLYHHLLSALKHKHLMTFDDGTENVNQLSKFFRNKEYSFIRKAFQRLNGRRYWLAEVLANTECHFTIYKNLVNVVETTEYIPLYKEPLENSGKDVINILIGSVYRDMVVQRSQAQSLIELLDFFIHQKKIDCYIPHPREENQYFSTCETIVPDQMSEEFIIQYLEKGYYVNLYGFGGSTQLNLDGIKNLTNHLFESHLISDRIRYGYTLFQGVTMRLPLQ